MELYLDSIKIEEIQEANKLGFLTGLTSTLHSCTRKELQMWIPLIVQLSKMTNMLHIEALGNTAEEIIKEVERLLGLGLNKDKAVFKTPISFEGAKACKILTDKRLKVNIHLVYTIQQAYIAFCAGATYVCPLVGRLQDQGQDALALLEQCVKAVDKI